MGLFTDRLITYSHGPDYPLSLTLAFGGVSGFYNGFIPLSGKKTMKYSLYPHRGDCFDARMWEEARKVNEPLTAQLHLPDDGLPVSWGFLMFGETVPDVTAMVAEGTDILVRMFNPTKKLERYSLTWHAPAASVEVVSPDGRTVFENLDLQRGDRGISVSIPLHGMGIKTIRFTDALKLQ
jgi:hypothetical protein